MSKIYILDALDLSILSEADNLEDAYYNADLKYGDAATIISPNPPQASLIIWHDRDQ